MNYLLKVVFIWFFLACQSLVWASDSGWLSQAQNSHAKIRLQADRSDPKHTRLLLDVVLEDGWKTYWHSPGEGGVAPQILWQSTVKEVSWHWPTPRHFEVAGLNTQGYQQAVSFPLTLQTDETGPLTGVLRLSTCSNVCILTDYPFTLSADGAAPTDFDFAFAKAMSQLPQNQPRDLTLQVGYLHNQLQVKAERNEDWQQPALFIAALEGAEFAKPNMTVNGNQLVASVAVSDGWHGDSPDLRGQTITLVLTSGEQAWQVSSPIGEPIPLPTQHSLLWLLAIALLGGLILNLMPCVLPVLALKLGSVLQQQERSQRQVRRQFLASSAGIICSFWLLAAMSSVLRASQGAVGWGIQFQSVGFIVLMVLITWLFCANLLGLFEIRLSSQLTTSLASQGDNSLKGHFVQGAFATLLATPCSAPFLGTAVAFALAAPLPQLWLLFSALGVGMSLPWLLVALWPRLALWLPKPGRWMNTLRILLGVMMLGSSLWLASLLTSHFGQTISYSVMAVMLVLLLVGIVYRYGRKGAQLSVASSMLLAALLVFSGAWSGQNNSQLDNVRWLPLSEQAISQALEQNKRVFIDVTADWCVTCKANKYNVLLQHDVQKALRADDIVALRGDWSKPDDSIAAFLRKRGAVAVPFNQIYGPNLRQGVILSPLLDKTRVLNTLATAQGEEHR